MKRLKNLNTALYTSLVLLAGCASSQPERINPVADLFVQFEEGDSSFNNRFELKEHLEKELSSYKQRPVVVVVASGNTSEEYSLATARLNSIVNEIEFDADYRVFVKPLERSEQKDKVAIYHTDKWDAFHKKFMRDGDYSVVNGSKDIYRSSDERLFLTNPTKRVFHPEGKDQLEQLQNVLSELGWVLEVNDTSSDFSKLKVNKLEVVTLENHASFSEVRLFVSGYLEELLPYFQFDVDEEHKQVRVWSTARYGERK